MVLNVFSTYKFHTIRIQTCLTLSFLKIGFYHIFLILIPILMGYSYLKNLEILIINQIHFLISKDLLHQIFFLLKSFSDFVFFPQSWLAKVWILMQNLLFLNQWLLYYYYRNLYIKINFNFCDKFWYWNLQCCYTI